MAIQELHFTKDWNNAEDFPVVAKDAAQARANIQALHDETKNYINDELVPALQDASNFGKHCWRVRDFDIVTGKVGEYFRYIYSDDRNAYPDSGIADGFEYEYLGVPVDFATPPGGKAGQVLTKVSDADHDYMWADIAAGGGGGGGGGGGSGGTAGAVRYDINQGLSSSQKTMARDNIGAASQSLSIAVEGLTGKVDEMDDEFEGIKLQVGDATGRLSELAIAVDEISAKVDNGGGDSSELSVKVDEIEATVKSAQGDITTLAARTNGIEARVTNAEGDIGELDLTAKGLTSRVTKAEEDIKTNSGEITGVKTQYSEVKQTAESLTSRVTKAESDIKTNSGEINTVKEQYSEVKQTADSLTTRVSKTESDIKSNSNEIATVKTQYSEVKQTATDLTSRVSAFEGDLAELEDNGNAQYSEIKQTIQDISLTVSDPVGGSGTNRYVNITLTVDGVQHRGTVLIDGNVNVSGQLSAEALYATLGDIARLKVDSLSTSRRIPMYLDYVYNNRPGKIDDDYYIDIKEQHIVLRRAWTDGSTEQAVDDFGAELFWEKDIENATIGSDGYPIVDGARVFITTEATDWPVKVFSYEEGDRLLISFDEINNYGPRMVFGEGDGSAAGNGRGYIEKPFDFNVYYKNQHGQKHGIFMGEEFTHINGLPLPTAFSFSGNDFAIAMQDGKSINGSFGVTDGELTSITVDGHTVSVSGV